LVERTEESAGSEFRGVPLLFIPPSAGGDSE
jgi:hypothetical protein